MVLSQRVIVRLNETMHCSVQEATRTLQALKKCLPLAATIQRMLCSEIGLDT